MSSIAQARKEKRRGIRLALAHPSIFSEALFPRRKRSQIVECCRVLWVFAGAFDAETRAAVNSARQGGTAHWLDPGKAAVWVSALPPLSAPPRGRPDGC